MTFKIFWWTEFILNLSTQSKKLPAVQWQAALPLRLSCPIMLHGSRASQPLSKALKMSKEATFSPRISNELSWTGQGEMVPLCQCAELGSFLSKPKSLGGTGCWSCPLAERPSRAQQSRPLSRTYCPHFPSCVHVPLLLFGLPILLPTVFHVASIQPKGFQLCMLKAMKLWPSLKISYFTANLLRCISDAWCIKRVPVFKVCQYSMNSCKIITLFLHDVAPFSVSHWDVTYYIHLF